MTHIFYLQLILTSYSKYVKLDFFFFFFKLLNVGIPCLLSSNCMIAPLMRNSASDCLDEDFGIRLLSQHHVTTRLGPTPE